MGNSCFGSGSAHGFRGTKKSSHDPDITNFDARTAQPFSVSTSGGANGKTGVGAKYAAGPDSGEPPLNLELQKPALAEKEVETFFDNSQSETELLEAIKGAKEPSPKATATHVEVFSLSKPAGPALGDPVATDPSTGMVATGNTHVEVFSLNVQDDPYNPASPTHEPTETAHIDFSAFLDQSPKRSAPEATNDSGDSGITNPAYDPSAKDPSSSYSGKNFANSSHSSSQGTTNMAYLSDEEQPSHHDVSIQDRSSSNSDTELDQNCFFFGMESLKFTDSVTRSVSDQSSRSEEDREIAEIMSEIDTIEDSVWFKLRPPDDTDSTGHVTHETPSDVDDSTAYEDVLEQLKDVCVKVEEVLRLRGLGGGEDNSGIGEDWLQLPDLSNINKKYAKKTSDSQTETIKRLFKAAKTNDKSSIQNILDEYKRTQEKLLRMREIERNAILEKMKKKISEKKDKIDMDGDTPEDEDIAAVRAQYGAVMYPDDDDDSDYEVIVDGDDGDDDDQSDFSDSDVSRLSYTDSEDSNEDNPEAKLALKRTLTQDIQNRMKVMTPDDFQNVMDIYRHERKSIKTMREGERGRVNQSLWDKLAERRKHVDESIYEGNERQQKPDILHDLSEPVKISKSGQTNTSQSHMGTQIDDDLENILTEGKVIGIQTEELSTLHQHLLTRTFQPNKPPTLNSDDLDKLLSEHDHNMKLLRERREKDALNHRQKLLDRLKDRSQMKQSDVDDIDHELNETEARVTHEEVRLRADLESQLKQKHQVSRQDVKVLLGQYEASQTQLNLQRTHQRETLNQRLRDKLSNRMVNSRPSSDDVTSSTADGGSKMSEHDRLRGLDEEFYRSLVVRQQAGELSSDQLAQLIDQHLDQMYQLKRDIRQQLHQRRRERQREDAANQVSALVEDDKQKSEQVRQLRRQERDHVDNKLQEKLRKRKQKQNQSESQAPRKPERKRKSLGGDPV